MYIAVCGVLIFTPNYSVAARYRLNTAVLTSIHSFRIQTRMI